ncbi:ribosome maturation factor RimM [Cytophagaceae bacterium ABcell3]|nr:ribosome maturation factor RimM [Cytophagaceae bacterium ABcell3]
MDKDSCFKFGFISKVHGLKGDVIAQVDVKYPEEFIDLESLFVEINKQLIPFFIEDYRLKQQQRIILKFEDVDNSEQATELIGKSIFLPNELLPEPDEGEVLLNQLVGCAVHDKVHGVLGVVDEVYEMPGQDLIGMTYQGKEVLIPVNGNILLEADYRKKILLTELPAGLLDLYLNDDATEEED